MPTIKENLEIWGSEDSWTLDGEEWSEYWGGVEAQWWGSVLPRIHSFVPTDTILEIAPGYGRWTNYLKDMCRELIIVDLNESCIDKCRTRFKDESNIRYYVNDSSSLDFVEKKSVDFLFSFDSLVHADPEVIEIYLRQLGSILKPNGVGFIHHSNLGQYRQFISPEHGIKCMIDNLLDKMGLRKKLITHWRDQNMTAQLFEKFCSDSGLDCISQEIINWGNPYPIDCISLFTPKGSVWSRPNNKILNSSFVKEGGYISKLSGLYCSSKLLDKNSS